MTSSITARNLRFIFPKTRDLFSETRYLLALCVVVLVRLDPSRPLSKWKRWVVAEILKKAQIYIPPSAESKTEIPSSSTS
ncbi:hypothetical protein K2173_026862 [Erythroxylum novogranatense]|uniref:Uncharacterized protein n=1 Tax=Erythroxylum novogranatense TaxID=1862640 RepID=A0AAV8TXH9_9ROSI|nr:hypothetical protein K2173_026862 [Erythroxylum novogranatense]